MLNWEDTILRPDELIRLKDFTATNTDIEASLTKQAKTSFKAGALNKTSVLEAAIIKPGDPDCVHYEVINSPSPGEHMVGVCRKCGRAVDYTIIQMHDPAFRGYYGIFTRDVNMKTIMKGLTGDGAKRNHRKKKVGSRGRVCQQEGI